jgi:membrane dipeptidase
MKKGGFMKEAQRAIIMVAVCFLVVFGCDTRPDEEKAADIHKKVLTVDTHVDTPLLVYYREGFDLGDRHDKDESPPTKVDFPRMKEGGLDAVFFAIFVGQGARTTEGNENAKQQFMDIYNTIYEHLQKNRNLTEIAYTSEDAYRIEKEEKRAIFFAIENGYPVGNDLSLVETYYDMGVRYITLCQSKNNDICDSSTDADGPEYGGLSDFGKQVVQEMNRLGIIVDVSHVSDDAFYDVLELSTAPVIASHSNARAIYDHARNIDDAMLKKLAENGGVIQLSLLYVKEPDPDNPEQLATVAELVDHIDHVVDVAGIDHVGIGTDFDGGGEVEGCFDVSEIGNITLELVKRGYSEEEIRKIWGGNLMRVFEDVEKTVSQFN